MIDLILMSLTSFFGSLNDISSLDIFSYGYVFSLDFIVYPVKFSCQPWHLILLVAFYFILSWVKLYVWEVLI